jgi:hypothetical protein
MGTAPRSLSERFTNLTGDQRNHAVRWTPYFCICCMNVDCISVETGMLCCVQVLKMSVNYSFEVKIFTWAIHFRSSISDLWIEYKGVLITSIWSKERFSFSPHPLGSIYLSARRYQGWVLQQTQDDAESKLLDAVVLFIHWVKAV